MRQKGEKSDTICKDTIATFWHCEFLSVCTVKLLSQVLPHGLVCSSAELFLFIIYGLLDRRVPFSTFFSVMLDLMCGILLFVYFESRGKGCKQCL